MAKAKIVTDEQVYNEMIAEMNKKDLFCTRLDGSKYIPQSPKEIPEHLKSGKMFTNAKQRVRYRMIKDGSLNIGQDIGANRTTKSGRWTISETELAIDMHKKGKHIKDIAKSIGRTYYSVKDKFRNHGITNPDKIKINKAMANYKSVARTGRVNEDTFTNLVREYSQQFKIDSMSLTNEGTFVVKWREVKS